MSTDDRERLLADLKRAHERAETAAPASPEWDAAMAAVEDLETHVGALRPRGGRAKQAKSDEPTTLRLGPLWLGDETLVTGMFSGPLTRIAAMRSEAMRLADRTRTRPEFVHDLEGLAERLGFVVETGAAEADEITFYAWHDPANTTGD